MKSVPADICTSGRGIAFDYLHMTDGTEILHVIFVLLFVDYWGVVLMGRRLISFLFVYKLEKVKDTIRVDSTIGDYISELFVAVFGLVQ